MNVAQRTKVRSVIAAAYPFVVERLGYSSGLVLIFREPHPEHFMCLPISGTGVSSGKGTVAGVTLRSRPKSQQ
jgi:hypothetical protein